MSPPRSATPLRALVTKRRRRFHAALALGGLVVLGAILVKASSTQVDTAAAPNGDGTENFSKQTRITVALALPSREGRTTTAAPQPEQNRASGRRWRELAIKRGDTLSALFAQLGIHQDLTPVLASGQAVKALKAIRPGQSLRVHTDDSGLQELELVLNKVERLHVERTAQGFRTTHVKPRLETRQALAAGTIRDSLFMAGKEAGLPNRLIMDLAGIFGWDIDFALDIRAGDRFTVIYEEYFLRGEKVRDGTIVAAEFHNQDKTFQAFRYTTANGETGYYAPDGHSMRKQFIRTPVSIARITSRFNLHRKHPILNRIRAHKGVDYAAPTGTPIKATGNGKVVFRGRKGGYGKAVILKHGTRYTTLYGHMSRFAKGIRPGRRVKQGQVIGYIGMTGLATGPHLHYEFRVNGVHRNPLKVRLPKALPLPEAERAAFSAIIAPLQARIEAYHHTRIASNAPPTSP
jgi:murein DD-endopeptidase MepM/ murein hydrolase activator NlpD